MENGETIEVLGTEELEKMLANTRITVEKAWASMTSSASAEVIKEAKNNVRTNFKTSGNEQYNENTRKRSPVPIIDSFKKWTSKRSSFVSYIKSFGLASNVQEHGGKIAPKNKKYLRFKIGGNWKVSKGYTITPKPFLNPAYKSIYETDRGRKIMDEKLKTIIENWWNKGN